MGIGMFGLRSGAPDLTLILTMITRCPRTVRVVVYSLALMILSACADPASGTPLNSSGAFVRETIDPTGPNAPWGKSVGDIDGDGRLDIVVGGHQRPHLSIPERILRKLGIKPDSTRVGELVWYRNPDWKREVISERFAVRTDIEVADMNGDGANDIAFVADSGTVWLENGSWIAHAVDNAKFHDLEVHDLDLDGNPEIVVRNQSLFGYDNGDFVRIYRRLGADTWNKLDISVPHGEGLKVTDLDGDGFKDIVVNDVWLKNPGQGEAQDWLSHRYVAAGGAADTGWQWPDVYIDTADFNHDGRPDIVLSPAEEAGETYQIAWFENPVDRQENWPKHLVDGEVEAVHHFIAAADVEVDGDVDILTAEMNQGEGDNPVSVYLNEPSGWRQQVLSTGGGHSLRAVDIDNDFDTDLIGTNWQIADYHGDYPVWLWRNRSEAAPDWRRHVVDEARPGQATFVFARDVNGDGRPDLITGGYWYENPGSPDRDWTRRALGAPAHDAAFPGDFDGDGDVDILATGWRGYGYEPTLLERLRAKLGGPPPGNVGERLVWAENSGSGEFTIRTNIEQARGDFLQGTAFLPGDQSGLPRILLSWHQPESGLQAIVIPGTPRETEWTWELVSELSQDEAITVVDIDADGVDEVVLGTRILLQARDGGWSELVVDDSADKPDRHRVADINQDGRLDIVVGFEAVSEKGDLVWYEQPELAGSDWRRHLVARVTGPMSLDVTDMDNDGDSDIVVGEHDLRHPEQARMMWFENRGQGSQWLGRLIYTGDEHHDGAVTVDIDGDGDRDVVSIGWSHGKVLLYENLAGGGQSH